MIFRATRRWRVVSSARKTRPIAPWPISACKRNRPSRLPSHLGAACFELEVESEAEESPALPPLADGTFPGVLEGLDIDIGVASMRSLLVSPGYKFTHKIEMFGRA